MIDSTEPLSPAVSRPLEGRDSFGYVPAGSGYDEVFDLRGAIRPAWQSFFDSLHERGLPGLVRHWHKARDLIRENGVTYNVYGDPGGLARQWQLDPMPLLLEPAEAETLGTGLIQRGRILEALLRDLYGPQRVLAEGLLPPELVFANPAFLRSCHGMHLPGSRYLHLYAANVGRGEDGSFNVLGDRTQAPSGAGYVLENRIVMSRMLPETFRDCRVQRIALFFQSLRNALRSLASHRTDNPRIVLLTPGPYNETYFEHAYLARYLGYTLVEGADLTVRDNRVYLKVLGGLQPVDVIFRRLDDDYCDPLELRSDSFLGLPGLVQAVRSGNVAIANALGSGLLEMPALLAFLPALCRRLLGEELRLSSTPTWWCGDPTSRSHVLSRLSELVIKPALAGSRMEPVFGSELSRDQRAELAGMIRSRPHFYCAQERLPLSATPVLVGHYLQRRHMVLRCYLAAQDDSFACMPGGLTRVSALPDKMDVSMQHGGGSKDTWVISTGPVSEFSLLRPSAQPVELTRGGSDLPSRVADNLFWLGRYVERAEGLTRLLRCILVRMTETAGLADVPELPALLQAATRLTASYPGFVGEGAESRLVAPEEELLSLIHDTRLPGSLASVLNALGHVAGISRDRISIDMWRVLRDLGKGRRPQGFRPPSGEPRPVGVPPVYATNGLAPNLSGELNILDGMVLTLAAFGGLAMESMTRGEGWRFLDMGRKLERSLRLVGLLQSMLSFDATLEGPTLEALLEIADSAMTYRRRYQGSLQSAAALDLLLADETNPRSLTFQLVALAEDAELMPYDANRPDHASEMRPLLTVLTALRLAIVSELARAGEQGDRPVLGEMLDRLAASLPALSDTITRNYLSHLQTARHLGH